MAKQSTCSFQSIIRWSGIYDILVMLPFAMPGVVGWAIGQLQNLHDGLMLSGSFPQFLPFHLLFINIMAIITVVWSVLRVIRPLPLYALYDTISRILIALFMLIYLVNYQVTEVFWLFFCAEVFWAMLQINAYYFKHKNTDSWLSRSVWS